MDIIYSIFLAIIQGVTEFVPVSSSGHLIILHDLISFNLTSDLAYDVALHAGTFFAIVFFFAKDINYFLFKDRRLLWLIILGAIPAGIAGLFLEDFIDIYLRNIWTVVLMLIVVGILFIVVENHSFFNQDIEKLTWKQSLFIGFAQILALIPGTSRSGITIIAGMSTHIKRSEAARFSFLLGLPLFAGATLKKTWDLSRIGIESSEWGIIIIGLIVSMCVGYFCVKYFLKFLEKYSLKWFAYYRFVLAGMLIIYLVIK